MNALAVVTESAGHNMGQQVKDGLKDLVEDADNTPGKQSSVNSIYHNDLSTSVSIGPYATAVRKLKQALSGEAKPVQPESASYVEE